MSAPGSYSLPRSRNGALVGQRRRATENDTMAHDDPTDDLRTELRENDDGFCTLQVRTKRGDGTRDEDRVTATLGRDTLEEVENRRERMMAMIRATVTETREMQPGQDETTEDADASETVEV